MSKTVKLSDKEYALLKKAKDCLVRRGTDRLPAELRPSEPSKAFTFGRMAGLAAEALSYCLSDEGGAS